LAAVGISSLARVGKSARRKKGKFAGSGLFDAFEWPKGNAPIVSSKLHLEIHRKTSI
jgi:hypothetical protein